jgi:hypothetical protein
VYTCSSYVLHYLGINIKIIKSMDDAAAAAGVMIARDWSLRQKWRSPPVSAPRSSAIACLLLFFVAIMNMNLLLTWVLHILRTKCCFRRTDHGIQFAASWVLQMGMMNQIISVRRNAAPQYRYASRAFRYQMTQGRLYAGEAWGCGPVLRTKLSSSTSSSI